METKPTNPKDKICVFKMPLTLWPLIATIHGCLALLDGMLKYGRRNWRAAGVQAMVYVDAALRHILKWAYGEKIDPDSGVHHLGHALACLAILLDAEADGTLVDDREYNGAASLAVLKEFTPLVEQMKAKYADRHPQHFDIRDQACEQGPDFFPKAVPAVGAIVLDHVAPEDRRVLPFVPVAHPPDCLCSACEINF